MKQRTKKTWVVCLAALLLVLPAAMQAQVHIGGNTDAVKGALLDLTTPEGSNLGLLPLNVYIDNINQIPDVFTNKASIIAGDLQGLIVYNINPNLADGEGLYVWDGTKWSKMIACTGAPTLGALTAPALCIGNNLTMTANVISDNGSAVTGYEWKLGGTTIGTSASLSYAVQIADNGKALTLSATNICGTTTTTGVTVTVGAAVTQGTPTAVASTICTGTGTTINLAVATGGVGAYTYSWEKSANGANFTIITGSNVQNYSTGNLTADTWFRRIATAATCGTNTSAAVKVTVNAAVAQGTPTAAAATICTGTGTTINLAVATGGVGAYTYSWEKSTNGTNFTIITGSNVQNYSTGNLTVDTWYRRIATAATCGTNTSAAVKVTVNAAVAQGTPTAAAATICNGTGTTINLAVATGGVGAYTYSWEKSTNGTNFTIITGSNVQNYSTGNLTADTWFRRIATAATCGTNTSASVKVTVNTAFTQANPVAATINACSATTHAFTVAAATGGSGAITYQWETSTNNSTWTTITGANSANYTTPALSDNTYYRRKATAATCGGTITSASALVTVTKASSTATIGTNTYTTYCYGGNIGTWMVENSKEGTAACTHATYGKYYYFEDRHNACISPWSVPTRTQWEFLQSYINGTTATTSEKAMWIKYQAANGYCIQGNLMGQGDWGGAWWSDSALYEYFTGSLNLRIIGPATWTQSVAAGVRCMKP